MMSHIFFDLPGSFTYIHDILLFSKSEKEHLQLVEEALQRLAANGLAIHLEKCVFGQNHIDFLGYKVTPTGITPLPRKVAALQRYPPPQTPKNFLGFLGAVNFYRCSLTNLDGKTPAEVLDPLYKAATMKTKPRVKFKDTWQTLNLDTHFAAAKQLLVNAATLVHPDPAAPLSLTCDASKGGL